jgi:hypothetical protein
MFADWKRPSSVSSLWPFGWAAWGAAVQLGIEIDTGPVRALAVKPRACRCR